MMLTSSLDILEESLLSGPQAKAILRVMESELVARQEVFASRADLSAALSVAKTDLIEVRSALKGDILEFRVELKSELLRLQGELRSEMKDGALKVEGRLNELTRFFTLVILGQTTVFLTAIYFLLNFAKR